MKNQKAAKKFEEERKSQLLEKSVQENLDIRMKTKKEVESELNKFKRKIIKIQKIKKN